MAAKQTKWVALAITVAALITLLLGFYAFCRYNVTQRKQNFIRASQSLREDVSQTHDRPTEEDVVSVVTTYAEETGCELESLKVIAERIGQTDNLSKLEPSAAAQATATQAQWVIGIQVKASAAYGVASETFEHERFTYLYAYRKRGEEKDQLSDREKTEDEFEEYEVYKEQTAKVMDKEDPYEKEW